MTPSKAFRWAGEQNDWDGAYLPPAALALMRSGMNDARCSGWLTGLPHGVPLEVTVVKPEARLRADEARRWIEDITRIVAAVDAACQRHGTPVRPASLSVTVYLWHARKQLPERPGAPITPAHCNSGVCVHDQLDGSRRILVYRNEDAHKTVIHEVLHAYEVGTWCNMDAAILGNVDEMGRAVDLRSSVQVRPAESVVDALAIIMYSGMYARDWPALLRRCDAGRRRALRHFRGTAWAQDTHAFEYLVVRHALLTRREALEAAFDRGLQAPRRGAVRAALRAQDVAELVSVGKGRVTGTSLSPTT